MPYLYLNRTLYQVCVDYIGAHIGETIQTTQVVIYKYQNNRLTVFY